MQTSHCDGFSCRAQAVGMQASVVAARGFNSIDSCGAWDRLLHGNVGFSQSRDLICVSCNGRQTLPMSDQGSPCFNS